MEEKKSKFIKFDVINYNECINFGYNRSNRDVNKSHMLKLKRSFLNDPDLIPAITVNTITNNVIDGQHRLEAFKSLVESGDIKKDCKLLKVMYVEIRKDLELSKIIEANEKMKRWVLNNYIQSRIEEGDINYIRLRDWCLSHPLVLTESGSPKYRYAVAMILGAGYSKYLKGGLVITEEKLSKANQVYKEIDEILNYFEVTGAELETLSNSWNLHRDLCLFEDWKESFRKNSDQFKTSLKRVNKKWDDIFKYLYENR